MLFGGGDLRDLDAAGLREAFKDAPRTRVSAAELSDGLQLTEGLVRTGLAPSKGRARTDINSGAISVNHVSETDVHRRLGTDDLLAGAYVVLRRGKKTYGLIEVG